MAVLDGHPRTTQQALKQAKTAGAAPQEAALQI